MTVRAVALAAAGGMLALLAAGCRGERGSGRAGQDAGSAGAEAKPPARRPETAVLTRIAIQRVDPARPRPIRDEELSARLGGVLTGSAAFAASGIAVLAAKFWLAVGLVTETVGGVLAGVLPMVQAVPFSVKAVGGLLVPLNVPLKATLKTPFEGICRFQTALLAAVRVVQIGRAHV